MYAALFCLEYKIKPSDIKIELRIYQNDEIQIYEPEEGEVEEVMNKIVHLDELLSSYEEG